MYLHSLLAVVWLPTLLKQHISSYRANHGVAIGSQQPTNACCMLIIIRIEHAIFLIVSVDEIPLVVLEVEMRGDELYFLVLCTDKSR